LIRPADRADLPRLRELFTRSNDTGYDLAAVAEEKCFEPGFAGNPTVTIFETEGVPRGVSVTCGRYLRILAVDRAQRRRGIGSSLLRDAEARGISVIGAEAGNYFTPGVREDDEVSITFLNERRYVEDSTAWNLEADLVALEAPVGPRRAKHSDAGAVLSFIEKEFGRIWRFESARAFDREEPSIFFAEENGSIAGFAACDANNRGLGFFGPMGVAPASRGRGIGSALTLAALAHLRALGHSRAVIPWTNALDYYSKCCGVMTASRFLRFSKRALDSAP
jgi:GNAT superfamily N-acetyltransferase